MAGLAVCHPVERGRLGVGLLKVDRGVFAHVECAPVHHRALAGLVDVEAVAGLTDAGLARVDLTAGGQLGSSDGGWCRGGLGQYRGRQKPHRAQKQRNLTYMYGRPCAQTSNDV